ncbi:MAG: prepilin-type N-terminal cleavage/methylation domain-containing protein [Candidatus Brocadiia bacterium]
MDEREGFTLIEVLVSLAVSVAVLGVAAVSLERVAFQDERSHSDFERSAAVLRFRHVLTRDLRRLRPSEQDAEVLQLATGKIAGKRADRLRLSRVGSLHYDAAREDKRAAFGTCTVLYRCREAGDGLTLFRAAKAPGDAAGIEVPVIRGVSHFGVTRPDGRVRVEIRFADGRRRVIHCSPHVVGSP